MDSKIIDLDALTYEERTALLVALLDKSPIQHIPLDGRVRDFAIMAFAADNIAPGKTCTIAAASFFAWRATHLVVLGQDRGPSPWSLHTLFVGAKNVVALSRTGGRARPRREIPLPLSGADGPPLFEPFDVAATLDVAIEVSHNLDGPASFRALLLGIGKAR